MEWTTEYYLKLKLMEMLNALEYEISALSIIKNRIYCLEFALLSASL
jgi:hypothetical protein